MKYFFLFFVLFICSNSYSQDYPDTLYYKSGMVRYVKITKTVKNTIYYEYVNTKGRIISSQVSKGSLKSLADGSSEEEQIAQLRPKRDSISASQSNFAINPFSPLLLGFNINYLARFGENYQHCLYIPARISSYFLNTLYADIGIGYAYSLEENENFNFLISAVPTLYVMEDDIFGGLIISLMGIKQLTNVLTLNGSFGVGPVINSPLNFPLFVNGFIGIGFNLGNKKIINK
jgi:hypothetical protein